MRAFLTYAIFLPLLALWAVPVAACGLPPAYFEKPAGQLLNGVKADAASTKGRNCNGPAGPS